MNCIVCKERGDVAVHLENDDPLIYCDDCRITDRPEARFRVVSEHRLTRRRNDNLVAGVASRLTVASCLSIRDEDFAGVDQCVLDAVSRILDENGKLRDENRKLMIAAQAHGRELRDPAAHTEARIVDLGVQHNDTSDAQKAANLTSMVSGELRAMVEKVSREIGIDRKWVLSDIVYIATQRIRQIKDPT